MAKPRGNSASKNANKLARGKAKGGGGEGRKKKPSQDGEPEEEVAKCSVESCTRDAESGNWSVAATALFVEEWKERYDFLLGKQNGKVQAGILLAL